MAPRHVQYESIDRLPARRSFGESFQSKGAEGHSRGSNTDVATPAKSQLKNRPEAIKDFPRGSKEYPGRNLSWRDVILFMRTLGKLFFPHLQPDQQRKRMNTIIVVVLVILAVGRAVGGAIFFLNKR